MNTMNGEKIFAKEGTAYERKGFCCGIFWNERIQ